jgi:hypothetical protein
MSNPQSRAAVKSELDRLTQEFFRSVSFASGSAPDYEHIHTLFIEQGLLIKNVGPTPEISSVCPDQLVFAKDVPAACSGIPADTNFYCEPITKLFCRVRLSSSVD